MNVYPREVEDALYQHPSVKDAAVIGVKDPHHGEIPKAFITLREGSGLTEREVKDYLRERLAQYKVPRQVEFVGSLPMSPTGKVLKRELRRTAG
jgi:acyl-CoA synthetase (AMP-forming)/AMP-acid ligase II